MVKILQTLVHCCLDCHQSPKFSHRALFGHIMTVMEDTHALLISKRRMFARSFAKIIQVQRQEAVVIPVVNVAEACQKLTQQRFSMVFFDVEQSTPLQSDSYGQQSTESSQVAMDETHSVLLALADVQQDLRFVPVFHEQQDEHNISNACSRVRFADQHQYRSSVPKL